MTNSGIGRENMFTPMVAGNKNLIESSGSCVKSLSLNLVLIWFYYWERRARLVTFSGSNENGLEINL